MTSLLLPIGREGSLTTRADRPTRTVTAGGAGLSLVAPYLVPRYGERDGQEPRTLSVEEPMPAVVSTGNGASLVAPVLSAAQQGGSTRAADEPVHAITASRKTRTRSLPRASRPTTARAKVMRTAALMWASRSERSSLRTGTRWSPRSSRSQHRHGRTPP